MSHFENLNEKICLLENLEFALNSSHGFFKIIWPCSVWFAYKNTLLSHYSDSKIAEKEVLKEMIKKLFSILLSGMPLKFVLSLILFSVFLYELFRLIKKGILANFADGNILYVSNKDLTNLLELPQNEIKITTEWLENNNIVVNPSKL